MNNFNFINEMQEARKNTLSYVCKLSEIAPINKSEIKIKGKTIPLSPTGFKDLLNIAGITNQMLQHLNETINPKAGFQLISAIAKSIVNKSDVLITIVFDTDKKSVVRLARDYSEGAAPIPGHAIENLLASLISDEKINLQQTFITDNGTKIAFNVIYDVTIPLTMPGEEICYGKQLTWDIFSDLSIVDMVERQVCTNGMTGIVPGDAPIKLNSLSDPSEWYKNVYDSLKHPNSESVKHYERKVLNSMQTPLSVYEFNKIKGHVMSIWRDDMERIIRHLGDDRDWKIKYEQKGLNLEKMTSGQLRNCPTPVNSWDAINLLTDLASHTYNSPVSATSKRVTQKMAGQLLNSNWDENSWVDQVPKFDIKRRI